MGVSELALASPLYQELTVLYILCIFPFIRKWHIALLRPLAGNVDYRNKGYLVSGLRYSFLS